VWTCRGKSFRSGESVSSRSAWLAWKTDHAAGGPAPFPPQVVAQIKAVACELPSEHDVPLSRFSCADLVQEVIARGVVTAISRATLWRCLDEDAIRPWSHRCWIFPRDPRFAEKGSRVLDLYQGLWMGEALGPKDYVISADEKTSIQARRRIAPTTPPAPGRLRRVEFEYERCGATQYIAAWDVRRAKVFGLCRKTTGIKPFHDLVDLVMGQEPYRSADRVFWITDNGSSHRGETSVRRLSKWYPNAILVHTPVHASWLNQVEIYFSIIQRKVLTPNDFPSVRAVARQLLRFQDRYEAVAKPFKWKFTRHDLRRLLQRLAASTRMQEQKAA